MFWLLVIWSNFPILYANSFAKTKFVAGFSVLSLSDIKRRGGYPKNSFLLLLINLMQSPFDRACTSA